MTARAMAVAAACLAGGAGVGWIYFLLLRRSVEALVARPGAGLFTLYALARVALFAGGLIAAIHLGAACIVTYALGFVAARIVMVRAALAGGSATGASRGPDDRRPG